MLGTETLTILIALFVLAASAVSGAIYWKLVKNGETVIAKMKLKSEETLTEFKALLYLHAYQTAVLSLFVIGGIMQSQILLDAGRALTIVYGVGMGVIFLRWLKRF